MPSVHQARFHKDHQSVATKLSIVFLFCTASREIPANDFHIIQLRSHKTHSHETLRARENSFSPEMKYERSMEARNQPHGQPYLDILLCTTTRGPDTGLALPSQRSAWAEIRWLSSVTKLIPFPQKDFHYDLPPAPFFLHLFLFFSYRLPGSAITYSPQLQSNAASNLELASEWLHLAR